MVLHIVKMFVILHHLHSNYVACNVLQNEDGISLFFWFIEVILFL